MSVEAIDVVTADGELVRADASAERRPLLGGARRRARASSASSPASTCGSTRGPRHVANGVYLYPIELLDEVFRWAHEIGPRVPRGDGADDRRPPRRRGRARDRGDRAGPRRQRRGGGRGARAAGDLPGARPGEARRAQRRRCGSPTSTPRVHAVLPRRAPLRGRQHVDARAGRRAAARPAADRRDAAGGALAHAVDELGPAARRRGRTWPTASRTTPTSPSTASGPTPPTTRPTSPGRPSGCARWSTSPAGSSSPTRTSAGARRASSATRTWRDSTSSAPRYDPDGLFHPWMGRP